MFGSSRPRYRFYPQERSAGSRVFSLIKMLVALFLLYELVSTFLVTSYLVESSSMRPALEPGERVVVSSLPFGASMPLFDARGPAFGAPRRGDLVVVETSYRSESGRLLQPLRSVVRFFTGNTLGTGPEDWRPEVTLRRVIAVPGDAVRMEDFIFYVRQGESGQFRSEFELSETRYALIRDGAPETWREELPFSSSMETVELGTDEYFLASDDRVAGLDSRHRGPVSAGAFLSRVLLRYWPLSRFGAP